MWNVVFVMGLQSLGMTARGMELGQAAHRFFSPPCSVAMALRSHRPKTQDEKRVRSTSVCAPVCLFAFAFFRRVQIPKRVRETSCILEVVHEQRARRQHDNSVL